MRTLQGGVYCWQLEVEEGAADSQRYVVEVLKRQFVHDQDIHVEEPRELPLIDLEFLLVYEILVQPIEQVEQSVLS